MEDPREHPFWKDNNVYCDRCSRSIQYYCDCPGGPRGPKLHPGLNDEPHGDDFQDN